MLTSGGSKGGGSLGQLLPPKPLWRPLEWRPFAINAPPFGGNRKSPFLVPVEIETDFKML